MSLLGFRRIRRRGRDRTATAASATTTTSSSSSSSSTGNNSNRHNNRHNNNSGNDASSIPSSTSSQRSSYSTTSVARPSSLKSCFRRKDRPAAAAATTINTTSECPTTNHVDSTATSVVPPTTSTMANTTTTVDSSSKHKVGTSHGGKTLMGRISSIGGKRHHPGGDRSKLSPSSSSSILSSSSSSSSTMSDCRSMTSSVKSQSQQSRPTVMIDEDNAAVASATSSSSCPSQRTNSETTKPSRMNDHDTSSDTSSNSTNVAATAASDTAADSSVTVAATTIALDVVNTRDACVCSSYKQPSLSPALNPITDDCKDGNQTNIFTGVPMDTSDSIPKNRQNTAATPATAAATAVAAYSPLPIPTRRPKVRFQSVEIREFSRTVSDNPSCSSGPPIGISWDHGESQHMNINVYEYNRGNRKRQLDMVLSRGQREKLLLDWGVPFHQIAEGTRTALRVKNQRRQTIVNSGKVAKLEETFEGASRRLKSALSIGRSRSQDEKMNHSVTFATPERQCVHESSLTNRMERQLVLAPNCPPSMTTKDDSCISTRTIESKQSLLRDSHSNPETTEPDHDIFEKLRMNVDVSTLASTSPAHAMLMKSSSRLSMAASELDESLNSIDGFTLGATTLGNNSTTPSQLEMERFYQELELECFGEMDELPSMVGQTLELPVRASIVRKISDTSDDGNEGVFDRPDRENAESTDMSISNSVASNPQSASFPNTSRILEVDPTMKVYETDASNDNVHRPGLVSDYKYYQYQYRRRTVENQFDRYPLYHQNGYIAGFAANQAVQPGYDQGASYLRPETTPFERTTENPIGNACHARIRQNSFDSYDLRRLNENHHDCYSDNRLQAAARAAQDHTMSGLSSNPPAPPMDVGRWFPPPVCSPAGYDVPQQDEFACYDEPQIRHMPFSSHLSPTQWMEGSDKPYGRKMYNPTVTIMEDTHAINL